MRILVNALPLVNVNTGIARYLRCLYTELERLYGDEAEFWYFDGREAVRGMPDPPEADSAGQTLLPRLFWCLPVRMALPVRVAFHTMRERRFMRAARGMDLYHEAAFFPFRTVGDMPVVMTVHDLSLMVHPEHHPAERVAHFKRYFFRRLPMVRRVLTVSAFTASEMRRLRIPAPAPVTTLLACDTTVFRPREADAVAAVRERLGVPERYFLFVGSGDQRKNLDVIPRALALAPHCDARLVVAGWSGWSEELAEQDALKLGYVSDEDLAHLYSGALGVVFCSSYEGFGLPVLEGMSCGCPVVTSRLASMPEVGGEAVLYVDDPRDPDELAQRLSDLAGDETLRSRLSRAGLRRAAEFSWERCARETFAVFRRCLEP